MLDERSEQATAHRSNRGGAVNYDSGDVHAQSGRSGGHTPYQVTEDYSAERAAPERLEALGCGPPEIDAAGMPASDSRLPLCDAEGETETCC
jgi:hypothetical protein